MLATDQLLGNGSVLPRLLEDSRGVGLTVPWCRAGSQP
jgi:hypothetical protein